MGFSHYRYPVTTGQGQVKTKCWNYGRGTGEQIRHIRNRTRSRTAPGSVVQFIWLTQKCDNEKCITGVPFCLMSASCLVTRLVICSGRHFYGAFHQRRWYRVDRKRKFHFGRKKTETESQSCLDRRRHNRSQKARQTSVHLISFNLTATSWAMQCVVNVRPTIYTRCRRRPWTPSRRPCTDNASCFLGYLYMDSTQSS